MRRFFLCSPIWGLHASTVIYQRVTHLAGFNNGTPDTTGIANTLFKPVNLSWNLAPNLSFSTAAGFYAPTGKKSCPASSSSRKCRKALSGIVSYAGAGTFGDLE